MLAKRIVGVVLIENGLVVRRVKQKTAAIIGRPEVTIQYLTDWDCDELIFINLSGDERTTMKVLDTAISECFVPLTVGGGINSFERARLYLRNGADKILLGRYASEELCEQIAEVYGKQAVVVSRDKDHEKFENKFAGEVILHDINRDGVGNGLNLFENVKLECPKILMGGCGDYKHIVEGLKVANGVAVGNLLHFKEMSAIMARNEAKKEGLLVR